MIYDQILAPHLSWLGEKSYIDSYKKGQIDDETFSDGIRQRIGASKETLDDEQLKDC